MLRDAGFDEVEDLGRHEILTRLLGVPPEVAAASPGAGGGHLVPRPPHAVSSSARGL